MNEIQGWINLYKNKNISSFRAINKVKSKFSLVKIGHAGTLDPAAEGILPIAIGKATKLISFINNNEKIYKFNITWGSQTSTDDSEGDIISISKTIPKENQIRSKLNKFIGYTMQIPPRVSAVKINGKRAYELARHNLDFSIKPKNVFLKRVELLKHSDNITSFEIECGKGFYVRSFGRDLAKELGTLGHISYLERTKVGKFTKESSILLDDLLKISDRVSEINCIQSSISMLDDILAVEIFDQNDFNDLSNGKSIKIDEKKLKNFSSKSLDEKNFFLSKNGDVISIGKLVGNLFKPNKVLI